MPISMNEAQNFMLKPKDNDKPCAAFLQYSELDLIEMSRLRQQLKYSKSIHPDFQIDMETILTNYEGESIFMLFKENLSVYSFLEDQINR